MGLLASVPGEPETDPADWEVAIDVAGKSSTIACRDIVAFTVEPVGVGAG